MGKSKSILICMEYIFCFNTQCSYFSPVRFYEKRVLGLGFTPACTPNGQDNLHEEAIVRILKGPRQPLLVNGSPGCGKSTCLAEMCERIISNVSNE
jgi:Tfp pilus assembly pilus retraction ATPase PilT